MALILSGDTGVPASGMPTGSVIQTVTAQFDNQGSQTISTSTPTATALTISITPKSATSKIFITANTQLYDSGSTYYGGLAIYRNGSTSLGWTNWVYSTASGIWVPAVLVAFDLPATTSSTSYTVYGKSGNGSIQVFWGSGGSSTITAMEIQV